MDSPFGGFPVVIYDGDNADEILRRLQVPVGAGIVITPWGQPIVVGPEALENLRQAALRAASTVRH